MPKTVNSTCNPARLLTFSGAQRASSERWGFVHTLLTHFVRILCTHTVHTKAWAPFFCACLLQARAHAAGSGQLMLHPSYPGARGMRPAVLDCLHLAAWVHAWVFTCMSLSFILLDAALFLICGWLFAHRPNFYVHCPTRTDESAAPAGCQSIMCLLPVANVQEVRDYIPFFISISYSCIRN